MEEYIITFLRNNKHLYMFDLFENDLNIVYNLYKNDLIDETMEYSTAVYNYFAIYYMIKRNHIKAYEFSEKTNVKNNYICVGKMGCAYNNVMIELKYQIARELLEKEIDNNNYTTMNNLGYMYHFGTGVKIDYQKAKLLYEKAIEGGNREAFYNLGCMYHYGEGVEVDYENAKKLYEKAIELGHCDAISQIAYMYQKGRGVKQDYNMAKELYEKAFEAGNKNFYNEYLDLCNHDNEYERVDACAYSFYLKYNDKELLEKLYKRATNIIIKIKEENRDLKAQVQILQNEIDYRPGGKGYEEAKHRFTHLDY